MKTVNWKKVPHISLSGLKAESQPDTLSGPLEFVEETMEKLEKAVQTVEKVKTVAGKAKEKVKKLASEWQSGQDMESIQLAETFELGGDIGRLLGKLQAHRLTIQIVGESGSLKTQFMLQMGDEFMNIGKTVGFFSLEMGGLESMHTRIAIRRNISVQNIAKLAVRGDTELKGEAAYKALVEAGKQFDVVLIDSWTDAELSHSAFNDLRKESPDCIYAAIFQTNLKGGARGGARAEFSAPVVIQAVKVDDSRVNNYAYVKKNRENEIGLKYLIAAKRLIGQEGEGQQMNYWRKPLKRKKIQWNSEDEALKDVVRIDKYPASMLETAHNANFYIWRPK